MIGHPMWNATWMWLRAVELSIKVFWYFHVFISISKFWIELESPFTAFEACLSRIHNPILRLWGLILFTMDIFPTQLFSVWFYVFNQLKSEKLKLLLEEPFFKWFSLKFSIRNKLTIKFKFCLYVCAWCRDRRLFLTD